MAFENMCYRENMQRQVISATQRVTRSPTDGRHRLISLRFQASFLSLLPRRILVSLQLLLPRTITITLSPRRSRKLANGRSPVVRHSRLPNPYATRSYVVFTRDGLKDTRSRRNPHSATRRPRYECTFREKKQLAAM